MQIEGASGTQQSDAWDQLSQLSEQLTLLNRAVDDPSAVPAMRDGDLEAHMDRMDAEMSSFEAAVTSAKPEVRGLP